MESEGRWARKLDCMVEEEKVMVVISIQNEL